MAKTDNLTDFLTNTANAIRMAEGSTAAINPQDFEAKITALKLSVQTADANATSADILSGKTAWVNGTKISGSIGTKAATTIIPGTSDQTISSGVYLAGAQTIKGDSNLTADNIKSGTSIFGVTGTYGGSTPNLQSKSVTYTTNGTATITPDEGYDGLSSVDVAVNVASGGGGDTSETWVLNEYVDTSTKQTFVCSFKSNGRTFSKLEIGGRKVPGSGGLVYSLLFDDTKVADGGAFLQNDIYRKVTFATAPTGGLLTWLQSNAVKQVSNTAVQPSKALTVTSNGTTTITPDAPYDAIKQVDLTVNVASGGGGGDGFKITFPATATNWGRVSSADLLLSDGTVKSFTSYSEVSGKTIENVVGIHCASQADWYVLQMTLSEGSVAQCMLGSQQEATYRITTSNNTTITFFNGGNKTFWWPLADTVISAIQMYNTD